MKVSPAFDVLAEATFTDAKITGVTGSDLAIPFSSAAGPVLPGGSPLRPSFHDVPLSPGDRVPGVARYFGRVSVESALGPHVESIAVRDRGPVIDIDVLNALDAKYPELRASGFVNPGAPRTLRMSLRFAEQS